LVKLHESRSKILSHMVVLVMYLACILMIVPLDCNLYY